MRMLVLGGTVFLSRAVAEEGVRRGHDVIAACRGTAPLPLGVRHVPLDRAVDDLATVLAAHGIDGVDVVVDPARQPSWVRSAVAALPEPHWVFVSTVSVYADNATPGGGPESLPLLEPIPDDVDLREDPEAYGGMKVACEQVVREGVATSMTVRPGLIVGPGDPTGRFTYWPARLADPGPVLAPGSPEDLVQVIDVRDLAAWVVDLAERRTAGVLDAVGAPLSLGELLAEVADGVGAHPELVWVSDEVLLEEQVAPWSGPRSLPLWIPTSEYAGLLTHDAAPAYAAGLVTRPLADTARDTLAWLRSTTDAPTTGLTRAEEAEVLARCSAGGLTRADEG